MSLFFCHRRQCRYCECRQLRSVKNRHSSKKKGTTRNQSCTQLVRFKISIGQRVHCNQLQQVKSNHVKSAAK